MFSYKSKNYALLDRAGRMVIKGSGLRSRGMEKYLREFLIQMLRFILEERSGEIGQTLKEYREKLENHEMDIGSLSKTETLTESPETYRQKVEAKRRNASAKYELALASGREYRAGDQISYYVTGNKKKVRVFENCKLESEYDPSNPDENVPYYKAKLDDLIKRFVSFIPSQPSLPAI
jgi:DNA polymerase elongation subunit (family B)